MWVVAVVPRGLSHASFHRSSAGFCRVPAIEIRGWRIHRLLFMRPLTILAKLHLHYSQFASKLGFPPGAKRC